VARTLIAETDAAVNAGVASAPTAVDPTNGMYGVFGKSRRLLIKINSTFAGAKTFTFKAGAQYNPAQKSGQGDLVVSINADVQYVVLESARFAQADGSFYCDIAAAATGDIECVRLPGVG